MKFGSSHLRLVGSSADAFAATWLADVAGYLGPPDREALRPVLEYVGAAYSDERLPSGEGVLEHALGAAARLAALHLDREALAAALLFHCYAMAPDRASTLKETFGKSVADLAEGVVRMGGIGVLVSHPRVASGPDAQAGQLESLRKMLLAMVQDVRVVLIKLADHAQALRYVVKLPDSEPRRELARLTQDIFAPLANRLGVWQFK